MELLSISHRPELPTPVLIQAVNGFPIVPMTLEGAIALVLKVDGIKNPCRFDILKRIQGKEKMKLPCDRYGHFKVNPLTLYYDEIPKTSGLYYRIARQKNIQTRVMKSFNDANVKEIIKNHKNGLLAGQQAEITDPTSPRSNKFDISIDVNTVVVNVNGGNKSSSSSSSSTNTNTTTTTTTLSSNNTETMNKVKQYGYSQHTTDKGGNILRRMLNSRIYGNAKSNFTYKTRPNPIDSRRNKDKGMYIYSLCLLLIYMYTHDLFYYLIYVHY